LQAGVKYYIEALHKDDIYGDHLSVGWQPSSTAAITVIAGANLSAFTTSTPGNQAPGVSITSPANNASFTAPASITITANATDADGSISRVEFYNGVIKIGEDLTSPYSYSWSSVIAGNYSLTAKAFDNIGASTTSSAVNISVGSAANQPPTVSITSPSSGAVFTAPASVIVNATAADANGTVSRVEFYNGATKLGEDLTAPYSYSWSSVATGSYQLTAKAIDNMNLSTTSSVVNITVNGTTTACSGTGSISREVWTNITGKAVSTIPVSTAPSSTGVLSSFETPANQGDNYGQRIRGYVCVATSGSYVFYIASDDDAELYLSTDADPAKKTRIAYVSGWTAVREWTKSLTQKSASINLQAGVKYYIEALHKDDIYGDHLSVGWQPSSTAAITVIAGANLSAFTTSTPGNQAPTVSITSPANNASFTAPASITITANATDDGAVSKVEFYNGTTKLGEDLTAPYSYSWSSVIAGNYSLTAKAVDNIGANTTSSAVSVSVTDPVSGSLPPPWQNADVGAVPMAGAAGYNNGVFSIRSAGYDFWTAPDEFHYVYQPISANATIIAKVTSIQNSNGNALAGVMIRENLSASASFVAVSVNPTGTLLMSRQGTGSPSYSGRAGSAPMWLKLVRSGNSFTASASLDGVTWNILGTVNISMISSVYIGMAVTSHNDALFNTSTFSNVSVSTTPNQPPTVSITSPTNNAAFTAPANINLTAIAADADGSVSKVEFYNGTTKLGEDATAPYEFNWISVPQGSYQLTAKAIDNWNASTTSSLVNMSVSVANQHRQ
jgi:lysozyme family protein